MVQEEKDWIDAAIHLCKDATDAGVVIAMVRRQDMNDGADIVATNATTPEVIRALIGSGPLESERDE